MCMHPQDIEDMRLYRAPTENYDNVFIKSFFYKFLKQLILTMQPCKQTRFKQVLTGSRMSKTFVEDFM